MLPCNSSFVFLEVTIRYINQVNEIFITIVDTQFACVLKNFIWEHMNTNHGMYFKGVPITEKGYELLEPFERSEIELHTFIAHLANVPNRCGHKYVEHISYSCDNRAFNLIRCATEPYCVLNEEPLPYPNGIEKEWGITWHDTFFRVSHPQLRTSSWDTSDSNEISIEEKFQQAKTKLKEISDRDTILYNKRLHFDNQWEIMYDLYDKYDECVFSA
jgi:hypothetical protein